MVAILAQAVRFKHCRLSHDLAHFVTSVDSWATRRYDFVMYVDDFLWLPDIIEKLEVKHRVQREDVEEVFFNRPHFRFVESGYTRGEDVYLAAGQTDAGRYLIIFFIQKPSGIALIISARDMTKRERKRYDRSR